MPTLAPPAQSPTGQMPMPAQGATDPLANLRDIQLPTDVSALPALGWWLLGALLLISLITAGFLCWRHIQRRQYRRAAARLLQATLASKESDSEKLHQLNTLLKRVAIYAYPQAGTAGLYGEQWLSFLQQSAPNIAIDKTISQILTERLYNQASATAEEVVLFSRFTENWVNKHAQYSAEKIPAVNNSAEQGGQHAHL